MNGKFLTTNSSLFTNQNPEQLPDWMSNINVEVKKREALDWGVDKRGVFAEKQTVYRDEKIGTPRHLEASFNDTRLITAANIQLAKFLTGKYYKSTPKVAGNAVVFDVKMDSVAGSFKFAFTANAGKVVQDKVFYLISGEGEAEYPFSKAGLEECIADIKSNKVKTSRKVEAIGKTVFINKEEIIRRYNGKLRQATDKINELVTEGSLIGIGSNTFATIYDADELFPQMEKEASERTANAFEFAPNREHVAANPHTIAKVLAIDASKTLAQLFPDFTIKGSSRDNNELLVKAEVLSNNGIRKICDFCFGIERDNVTSMKFVEADNERMTIEQLLNKFNYGTEVLNTYLNTHQANAKRIYRGVVLTSKEIHRRLACVVNKDLVDDIVENWVERNLITAVNTTTYTTTNSFEDLLASIDTKVLSADELATIKEYQKKFGSGLEMERQDVKDTGVRNDQEIETSLELRLASVNNYISKFFKEFHVQHFRKNANCSDEYEAELILTEPQTGVQHKLAMAAAFSPSQPIINVRLSDRTTSIETAYELFSHSPILSAYLADKSVTARLVNHTTNLILSKMLETLSGLVGKNEANNVIASWSKKGLIENVGQGLYVSAHSFESLLQQTNVTMLSEADRKQIAAARRFFGEAQSFSREDVTDTGVRDMEIQPTDENLLTAANAFLAQQFTNFEPNGAKKDGEMLNYNVTLFDEASGLKTNVSFGFRFDNGKVASCHANLNGEKVAIANIKKVFATNETLNKYLQVNAGKRVDAPMIMTTANLRRKLTSISNASLDEIEDVVDAWAKTGKVKKIASNLFASKHTVEQLISMSNIKSLSNAEIQDKLERSKRDRGLGVTSAHVMDNDTRALVDNWSSERMVIHAKAEINKYFKDFDVLDAKVTNKGYEITARIVNSENGLRQKATFAFSMINESKVGNIENYSRMEVDSPALKAFIANNAVNSRRYKNVISNNQLKTKLASVIDVNVINDIVNELVASDILNPVSSETYASEYSLSEIVAHLSKMSKTDLDKAAEQREKAKRDQHAMRITDARVMDNDTRIIENERNLTPQMIQVRDKIKATAERACANKIITAKKRDTLIEMLNQAKTDKELDSTWRELKKYF
jgi:uncharacterized protein YfcZ (UPF0381/DUF406 family)